MHAWFLVVVSLLVLCPLRGERLRVLSWNVENYNAADRLVEGRWQSAHPKPEAAKAALRRVVLSLRPDVLCLQEMGDATHLGELQRDLAREGLNLPFAIWHRGGDADRHLAVLSRVTPEAVEEHLPALPGLPGQRMKRGVLELRWRTADGRPWRLAVFHLKSRLTEDPADPDAAQRRMAEAQALGTILATTADPWLVVGDANATPDEASIRSLVLRGAEGLRDLRPVDTRDEAWTYFHRLRDTASRIDYTLLAHDFPARLQACGVGDGADVLRASDHRPLWLELDFAECLDALLPRARGPVAEP